MVIKVNERSLFSGKADAQLFREHNLSSSEAKFTDNICVLHSEDALPFLPKPPLMTKHLRIWSCLFHLRKLASEFYGGSFGCTLTVNQ